jgi:hypothetical protein
MPFLVRGFYNNNPLTLTTETEEAFAKAFDWRLVEGFTDALSVTASRLQGLRNRRVCSATGTQRNRSDDRSGMMKPCFAGLPSPVN